MAPSSGVSNELEAAPFTPIKWQIPIYDPATELLNSSLQIGDRNCCDKLHLGKQLVMGQSWRGEVLQHLRDNWC